MPRRLSTTGLAEGTDQILAELQRPDAVAKAPVLAQPERSPLDLVMRELEPAAPQQTSASNDSSKFIVSLMGDQPPPRVDTESPVIAAMQPVSRLRRQRIRVAAGALAVVVLGVASAVMLSRGDDKPRAAASEAAHVTESLAPTTLPTVAPPSNIATPMAAAEHEVPAPSAPSNAPVATEVRPEPSPEPTAPTKLAIATKADTAATRTAVKPANTRSTSSKRPTAKKALALKEPTAKKPAAAKASTRKKPAQKTTTTKVTATKASAVKKSSTVAKRKTKK